MLPRISVHSLLTLILSLAYIITPILSARYTQNSLPQSFKAQFKITNQVLGQGSFGTVYRAIENQSNYSIAIKIGKMQYNQRETEEIKILRTLKANNVSTVSLIDSAVYNANFFIASELIEREDGNQLFMNYIQHHKISVLDALIHLRTLVSTMADAHALNIVHNDIKVDVSYLPDAIFIHRISSLTIQMTFI